MGQMSQLVTSSNTLSAYVQLLMRAHDVAML